MKGIILAGGTGSRLFPLTSVTNKQLLPVYDKPMIYYPLSTLMTADIREILIISTPEDLCRFEKLLGNGSRFGISLSYVAQTYPGGLAQAFVIGEEFLNGDSVVMVLGDNIFWGKSFPQKLKAAVKNVEFCSRATVFAYNTVSPEQYGVVIFNESGSPLRIEEKPMHSNSKYVVTGLYCYPNDVCEKARLLIPSIRGEVEISSLNNLYLSEDNLDVEILDKDLIWFDVGNIDTLLYAANYIETIETKERIIIGSPEEIAYTNHWINKGTFLEIAKQYEQSLYGVYLTSIAKNCDT